MDPERPQARLVSEPGSPGTLFAQIPDHGLIRKIGGGSYGELWLARNALGTYRAVKIVYRQNFAHERPFEREFSGIKKYEPISRSQGGLMDILQVGRDNQTGYFYYVMELADDARSGGAISPETYAPRTLAWDLQQRGRLPFEECLSIGLALTSALAHLHKNGLVHRDVKPSNVIFVHGIPELADIGLVTDIDEARSYVGTEGFIPPEGPGTPQADIYSLGKVLYEISTGRDRHDYPELPTSLGDTETAHEFLELNEIVIKACRSDPSQRYQTADQMHADLVLLQQGRSIKQVRKLQRRLTFARRMGIGAMAAAILAAGAYLGSIKQIRNANSERGRAQQALRQIEAVALAGAEEDFAADNRLQALPHLAMILRQNPNNRLAAERLMSTFSHRNWARLACPPLQHSNRVTSASFNRSGSRILTSTADGTAWIWDSGTGRRLVGPLIHGSEISSAEFSPDDRLVLTRADDDIVRLWDAESGASVLPTFVHGTNLFFAHFSPDGKRVMTTGWDEDVRIWEAASGQLALKPLPHERRVFAAAFNPDQSRLATAEGMNRVRVWDLHSGDLVYELKHTNTCRSVEFSPDGKTILSGSDDLTARLWNAQTGEPIGMPMRHQGPVWAARFSPDGNRVVTGSADKTARVWDARTGEPITPPLQHRELVGSVAFSPEGLRIMTGSWDRTARVWDAATGQPLTEPMAHDERVTFTAFHPDGQRVLTAGAGKTVLLWDISPGQPLTFHLPNGCSAGAFSPDGKTLATGTYWGRGELWNLSTGQFLSTRMEHSKGILDIRFSPNAKLLATGGYEGTARIWDAQTGKAVTPPLEHQDRVLSVSFDHESRRLLTASFDGTARVWDAQNGSCLVLLRHRARLRSARFSSNGQRIVTASDDRSAQVWDSPSGKPIGPPLLHGGEVWCAAFSPDGSCVLTGSEDKTARLWDTATGQPIGKAMIHPATVEQVEFSENGSELLTAGSDGVRIWILRTQQLLAGPFGSVNHLTFSGFRSEDVTFDAGGPRILIGSRNGQVAQLWDGATGQRLSEPLAHSELLFFVRFSADRRFILTGSGPGTARIWEVPEPALPVPEWLPRLAEAVAGKHLNQFGSMETARPDELWRVQQHIQQWLHGKGGSTGSYYARWAKWFLALAETRTIFPSSPLTLQGYAQQLLCRHTNDSFVGYLPAVQLQPTNANFLAQFAIDPASGALSEWMSRRAVQLDPGNAVAWFCRHLALDWRGDQMAALEAVQRATALRPGEPDWLLNQGLLLTLAKRWEDADRAYTTALEVVRNGNSDAALRKRLLLLRSGILNRAGRCAEAAADLRETEAFPRRDPSLPPDLIDLTLVYNAALDEAWHYWRIPDDRFAPLARGVQNFAGTAFDVRGAVQVCSRKSEEGRLAYPAAVNGITINRKCARLQFLQAAAWQEKDGIAIGKYLVHYGARTALELPIIYGEDLRDFYCPTDSAPVTRATPIHFNPTYTPPLRVFKFTWENPRPDQIITSLDFVSTMAQSAPFLLAVTAEE